MGATAERGLADLACYSLFFYPSSLIETPLVESGTDDTVRTVARVPSVNSMLAGML